MTDEAKRRIKILSFWEKHRLRATHKVGMNISVHVT